MSYFIVHLLMWLLIGIGMFVLSFIGLSIILDEPIDEDKNGQ